MTMIKAFENIHINRSRATVGSFDGVHLGHQALASELAVRAHAAGEKAVVVTFSPHPAVFFKRAPEAYGLTSPEERERLLLALGIDQVITIRFDQQVASLEAREFMQEMKDHLGITHLAAGRNFALGKGRDGDIPFLEQLGLEMGFMVEIAPPITMDGEIVSSSQIRKLLIDGNLLQANRYLGRPYSLEGEVIHGEHRGNRLGFATANMDISPDRLMPATGVYACRAHVDGMSYTAVTNIGVRPTFANPLASPRVEPHLLDLKEDLYGQFLRLELLVYLRPEKAFNSPDELIAQVNRDIRRTRELFDHGQ